MRIFLAFPFCLRNLCPWTYTEMIFLLHFLWKVGSFSHWCYVRENKVKWTLKKVRNILFGLKNLFPLSFNFAFPLFFSYLPIMDLALWMKKPEEKFGKCFEKKFLFSLKSKEKVLHMVKIQNQHIWTLNARLQWELIFNHKRLPFRFPSKTTNDLLTRKKS